MNHSEIGRLKGRVLSTECRSVYVHLTGFQALLTGGYVSTRGRCSLGVLVSSNRAGQARLLENTHTRLADYVLESENYVNPTPVA